MYGAVSVSLHSAPSQTFHPHYGNVSWRLTFSATVSPCLFLFVVPPRALSFFPPTSAFSLIRRAGVGSDIRGPSLVLIDGTVIFISQRHIMSLGVFPSAVCVLLHLLLHLSPALTVAWSCKMNPQAVIAAAWGSTHTVFLHGWVEGRLWAALIMTCCWTQVSSHTTVNSTLQLVGKYQSHSSYLLFKFKLILSLSFRYQTF